jgi:hypothetical protein
MAPIVLSPEAHEEIFLAIKNAFQDFALFEKLVSSQLRKLIADSNQAEIDVKTTRKLAERYFDESKFQTDQQKLIWQQIQIILRTTYVLILSYSQEIRDQYFWPNTQILLENYPQFQGQSPEELEILLKFRNYMSIALLIVPARLNKQLLLKIVSRLEGTGNEYITGGGQKPCVTRRVDIYEKEGSVVRKKIMNPPVKKAKPADESAPHSVSKVTGTKRKKDASSLTLKDVKLMRLPTDEIELLAQAPPDPFSSNAHQTPAHIPSASSVTSSHQDDSTAIQNLLFAANSVATVNDLNHILPTAPSSSSMVKDELGGNIVLSQSIKPISEINGFAPVINRQQSELLDRLLSESMYSQLPFQGAPFENMTNSAAAVGMDNLSQASVGTYIDPNGFDQLPTNPIPIYPAQKVLGMSRTSSLSGATQAIPMLRSLSWDVYNGLLMNDLDEFLNSSSQTM